MDRLRLTKACAAGLLLCSWSPLPAQEREPVPLDQVESGVGWSEVTGEPLWWQKPIAKTDWFSFRLRCHGEKASWVQGQVTSDAKRDVRNLLFDHLQPVLGNSGTLPVLEEMLRQTVLVDAVLGNVAIGTGDEQEVMRAACACWRTPIRSVVEKFEPSMQGRIEWILLRAIVHWQTAAEPPAWAGQLPQREGFYRCAFACAAGSERHAKLAGVSGVRVNVRAHLMELLGPILGTASAEKAVDAAVARLAPVAKVCVDARATPAERRLQLLDRAKRFTAYCLWEVPTAPMLRVLPESQRPAALAALRAQ